MAVLHGAAITLLAKYAVYHPTDQTLVVSVALAVLVGAAALWSALDAWRDLPDRGKVWFISALIAGPVAGILYVIGRAVFVDQTGVSELSGALTGGAAFSALLVLIPAGLGLFVGGRIGRSQPEDEEPAGEEAPPESPARRRRTAVEEPAVSGADTPRTPAPVSRSAPPSASPSPTRRRRQPVADGARTPRPTRRPQPPSEAPRG
jgi:phosphate/sulfate permease